MPIYDYACDQCGHRFEARQSFSDDPLTVCPECNGTIRRVIHPSGIIFKGSGWYITDSRKTDSAAAPASDSGSSSDSTTSTSDASSSTSSSSTSESKTAADD
ncbi:MAG: FmdB family zinc ribbon protein [Thermomicrobiales bacterium]